MQQKLSSKQLYKGHIFTLTQDQVKIENGMEVTRDIIHHHGGVGVLLVQENKILFVRQYRYPASQYLLEIPAGKLEENEDPYTCGLRELEEESGYQCQEMKKITSFYSTPGFCSEVIHLYEAINAVQSEHPRAMDEDECITLEWYPISEAMHMILDGRIQDAKTIIAIQYAAFKYTS